MSTSVASISFSVGTNANDCATGICCCCYFFPRKKKLLQIWLTSAICASAQSDQSFCCTHEEALSPWLPHGGQWRLLSDSTGVQADQSLFQPHMPICRFSPAVPHFIWCFTGETGIGKSTLMDTLFWCFTGETGIGKSTLMDTLFNTHFDSTPSTHDLPGVKLKANTYGMLNIL